MPRIVRAAVSNREVTRADLERIAELASDNSLDAHEAASDPHPTYLTQAEADALYAPSTATGYWLPLVSIVSGTPQIVLEDDDDALIPTWIPA